jgi:hypothetical protein
MTYALLCALLRASVSARLGDEAKLDKYDEIYDIEENRPED